MILQQLMLMHSTKCRGFICFNFAQIEAASSLDLLQKFKGSASPKKLFVVIGHEKDVARFTSRNRAYNGKKTVETVFKMDEFLINVLNFAPKSEKALSE